MIWATHKNGSDLYACFELPGPVEEAAFHPSPYLDAFNFKDVGASVILDETGDPITDGTVYEPTAPALRHCRS